MNAKHLETLIKQGHRVAVKTKKGDWRVFLFMRGDGCFQGTYAINTIQECLNDGFCNSSHTTLNIENDYTDEYEIVTPAPLMLKEGDLVDISENVREYVVKEVRGQNKINMIGQKGLEIQYTGYGYYLIYTKDKLDWFAFPARAVSLSTPVEAIEEEVQELTLEERVKRLEEKMF